MSFPNCGGCGRVSGSDYQPGDCRPCWLVKYHPGYRQLRDAAGATPTTHPTPPRPMPNNRRRPCVSLGPILEFCNRCGAGGEGRHVRECDRHERCTLRPAYPGVPACSTCPDYRPEPVDDKGKAGDNGSGLPTVGKGG